MSAGGDDHHHPHPCRRSRSVLDVGGIVEEKGLVDETFIDAVVSAYETISAR